MFILIAREDQVPLGPWARSWMWKNTSVPEMKNFLGLYFLTGILQKPSLSMFWCTRQSVETPSFARTMSRNRFELMKRYFHFSDNATSDKADPLYKVRPVHDYVVKRFQDVYTPGKNISIDEAMMLWKGRLAFKVYAPNKPIK